MTVVECMSVTQNRLRSGGYGDRHMTRKSVKKALRSGLGRLVSVEVEADDQTGLGGRNVRITVRGGDGFA